MAVNVILDKSSPANFQLVFPKLPSETTLAATEELTLNIFGTIVPGMTLGAIEQRWMGAKYWVDDGNVDFEVWNVDFVVDSEFTNWKTLHKWIITINDNNAKHGDLPSNYAVDATLRVTDNFNNEVLRIHFSNVWPQSLGEMSFTTREGERNMECQASFVYDRYELKLVTQAADL